MKKTIVCKISEEESNKMQGQIEMMSAIESLAMVIADNNNILKEDSSLYNKLIEDYKKYKKEVDSFWKIYLDIYSDRMDLNTQLSLDYHTCEISIIPM